MKFIYEYRTSDNVHHEGVVAASNREAAFSTLKAQGIRPASVREAPGLANKVFGKGKRWIAIAILSVLVAVAVATSVAYGRKIRTIELSSVAPLPRHQIYGDPALKAEMVESDFASVFENEGDRILARFAEPGVEVARFTVATRKAAAAALEQAITKKLVVLADSSREVNELTRIVEGMRDELRRYLANGVGTCETYVRRLEERQREEVMIRARTVSELNATQDRSIWQRRNAELRAIGIRTIPMAEAENE